MQRHQNIEHERAHTFGVYGLSPNWLRNKHSKL